MAVTKKLGRPIGSKNKPVDVAAPKRRGRPAGTRVKHAPTVESVRAEWSKKYAALSARYDELAEKHIAMAKAADKHRNEGTELGVKFVELQSLASERLIGLHKMHGIIEYLEMKLEDENGNS